MSTLWWSVFVGIKITSTVIGEVIEHLKFFYFVTAKILLSVYREYNTMICFWRYLNYRYGHWWGYWTIVIFKGRGGKICKNRDWNECLIGGGSALPKSPWTMKWPDKGDDHLFWQFCEGILMTFSDGSFMRHWNLINVLGEVF